MSFKPGPSRKAQEVTFLGMCTNDNHHPIYFNNIPVTRLPFSNILGCILIKNIIKALNSSETSPINFHKLDKLLLQYMTGVITGT